jgi:ketosteroid isomerase-like protein
LKPSLALHSNAKDVNGIMAVYLPDETLLVFDVVPPRQYVGAKAYRKDWENFLSTLKGPEQLQISDLAVETDGKSGWGHSIQHIGGTDTKGQPIDLTVRVTDVYRKVKGNWLIVLHEHVSIPVDLDTGKPDPLSKP